MARALDSKVTEVFVAQSLLAHLHAAGVLGGRRVHVLADRLPLWRLHEQLDALARAWPDAASARRFRASDALVDAERTAFAHAYRVVTSHAAVARDFGVRAERLPWSVPWVQPSHEPAQRNALRYPRVALARHGAFELRAALEGLDVALEASDAGAEHGAFWRGVRLVPPSAIDNRPTAIVLPAWVEHRPRDLLRALGLAVPVIASTACGLAGLEGVTEVEVADVDGLRAAIEGRSGGGPGSPPPPPR
jgi:hypothetical protein